MDRQPLGQTEGTFRHDWKPTYPENPHFTCRKCGSHEVWYRTWDSLCGSYEDVQYHCRSCNLIWWFESSDA